MAGILDASPRVSPDESVDWSLFGHVYTFANGKGGCGKTTTATNVSGLVAADGVRTLLVDLNGQGNVALNLGYEDTEVDDQGENLYEAVANRKPLTPVRSVRPNLDVVPGGKLVRRITTSLQPEMTGRRSTRRALLSLARCIEPIARDYGLIVIDSPPESPFLLKLALAASRFVIAPMNSDRASLTGLTELAEEFMEVRSDINEYLVLLGVFLFDSGKTFTGIQAAFRKDVQSALENAAPVFKSFIRSAESVAKDLRRFGVLAHELEREVANNPSRYQVKKGTADRPIVSTAAIGVASDFSALAAEIFTAAAAKRKQMEDEGVWP